MPIFAQPMWGKEPRKRRKMFKVGIIGAGRIAAKMAAALGAAEGVEPYAIASRDEERAQAFAVQHGMPKAYGSYRALLEDPDVDLVYIATPHSHHFSQAMLAIECGKPVLCEKAFTANAREAERLLDFAHSRGVFIAEAIMPRFLPLMGTLQEVLASGVIGTPQMLSATLSYQLSWKERVMRSELCGGALLDIGVYCLNFARMCFGTDIARVTSDCTLGGVDNAVDVLETITLHYADGRLANLQSGALCVDNRGGLIAGDRGYIVIDNVNVPSHFTVWQDYQQVAEYRCDDNQLTGLSHEVLTCRDALAQGALELDCIPHAETLAIMQLMDDLRSSWGVVYPNDAL